MTVFVDNETIFSGNAQEAFGAAPVFKVGYILATAHVQCLATGLKFALRATKRLAQAQANLSHRVSFSEHQQPPEQLRTVWTKLEGVWEILPEMAVLGQVQVF